MLLRVLDGREHLVKTTITDAESGSPLSRQDEGVIRFVPSIGRRLDVVTGGQEAFAWLVSAKEA